MSNNTLMMLVAVEAEEAAKQSPAAPLEDRARAAMKAARKHWMAPDEETAFMGACEGLARSATEDEVERIKADLESLQRGSALIGALQAGVPVDWDGLADGIKDLPEDRLGLRKIWLETAP